MKSATDMFFSIAGRVIPALLTHTSTGPNASRHCCARSSTASSSQTIRRDGDRLPACAADRRRLGLCALSGYICQHNRRPGGRERGRDSSAEPLAGTSHDDVRASHAGPSRMVTAETAVGPPTFWASPQRAPSTWLAALAAQLLEQLDALRHPSRARRVAFRLQAAARD